MGAITMLQFKHMPSGIYKRTKPVWNKGKNLTPEHIEKLKGKRPDVIAWNKGTIGVCRPNSGSFKNGCKINLGRHSPNEFKKGHKLSPRGVKHHSWKGGITPENKKIRMSLEMTLFRKACMTRDNFTCQKTGIKGGNLVVHHINNFASFPELRTSIENGITLSKQAHLDFHNKYGRKNNTKEQLLEFLNNKEYGN